jgi:hypothetical protein
MADGLPYSNIATSTEVVADPDPGVSGRAFKLASGTVQWQNQFRIALPTVVSGTCRTALRAWIAQLPSSNTERMPLILYQTGAGTNLVYLLVEQNGSITVNGRVAGVDTQIADSINPLVSPNSWFHYEFSHNVSAGTGSLRINGTERLTWTGVETTNNVELVCSLAVAGNTLGKSAYIKDLVIADSTGSQNNGVIGTVLVKRLKPNADVTLGGWTASTGTTGFNLLAKDAVNDTTYLSSAVPVTTPMQFDIENLPPDITSVRALLTVVRSRKVDGGDGNIQSGISPDGSTWDNGPDVPITTSFAYDFDVSELNPVTAAAWTPVGVDGAKVRVNRTV